MEFFSRSLVSRTNRNIKNIEQIDSRVKWLFLVDEMCGTMHLRIGRTVQKKKNDNESEMIPLGSVRRDL